MDAERCVCCGEIIPEGSQVCLKCLIYVGGSKLKPGTRFRANVSGAVFEILKIENNVATIRDVKTGMTINYGLRALEKCDVTILEVQ